MIDIVPFAGKELDRRYLSFKVHFSINQILNAHFKGPTTSHFYLQLRLGLREHHRPNL